MGADPDDAELPDKADPLAELGFSPELRAEFREHVERMREKANMPPTQDEHGNPPPRLDLENPPATPPEDPLLQIGYALLPQLPAQWERVLLMTSAAADEARTNAFVVMDDEDPPDSRVHFFADLVEPLLALRRAMYEADGRGAWYNANFNLYRDGTLHVMYDHLTPPFGPWGPREVELVLRDQELYPRDPENLPPWHPAR